MRYPAILLVLFLLITACQNKPNDLSQRNELYLLSHPGDLAQTLIACQENKVASPLELNQCNQVLDAARSFNELVRMQQYDPQQLGEWVLRWQMIAAKTQQMVFTLRQQLVVARSSQALSIVQTQLSHADQDYQIQCNKIQILLLIVRIGTVL